MSCVQIFSLVMEIFSDQSWCKVFFHWHSSSLSDLICQHSAFAYLKSFSSSRPGLDLLVTILYSVCLQCWKQLSTAWGTSCSKLCWIKGLPRVHLLGLLSSNFLKTKFIITVLILNATVYNIQLTLSTGGTVSIYSTSTEFFIVSFAVRFYHRSVSLPYS